MNRFQGVVQGHDCTTLEHLPGTNISLLEIYIYIYICICCRPCQCCLLMARTGQSDITCWIVSFCCLHAWHVSSFITLWMCVFIYFVEVAFFYIAHMILSVAILKIEDFNHVRLDFLSMCGSSMIAKHWPCTFFCLMDLSFSFKHFVLMLVFY